MFGFFPPRKSGPPSQANKYPLPCPPKQSMAPASVPGSSAASSTIQQMVVGGSDDCNTPDTISGTGAFAFDQTAATTGGEGQNDAPLQGMPVVLAMGPGHEDPGILVVVPWDLHSLLALMA